MQLSLALLLRPDNLVRRFVGETTILDGHVLEAAVGLEVMAAEQDVAPGDAGGPKRGPKLELEPRGDAEPGHQLEDQIPSERLGNTGGARVGESNRVPGS